MQIYKWDKARADQFQLPLEDDIAYRYFCLKLGGGDEKCGRWIAKQIAAHVDYADRAHPWPADTTKRTGINIAVREFDEMQGEFALALEYGLERPNDPCIDEAMLAEQDAHVDYENGDTIAVLVKLLRMAYGESVRDERR